MPIVSSNPLLRPNSTALASNQAAAPYPVVAGIGARAEPHPIVAPGVACTKSVAPMLPVLQLPLKARSPADDDASTNATPSTCYQTPGASSGAATPYIESPKASFEQIYQIKDKVLGSGAAGDVREAVCRLTGKKVAVKTYSKRKMSEKALQNMRSELDVQGSLAHPGIVKLEGVYESEEYVHVVMEQLLGGELFDRIIQQVRFTEANAAKTTLQILRVLVYLHSKRILHRDIKPENVMYVAKGGQEVKLIDFGFATEWDPSSPLSQKCGTMQYVAPEVLTGEKYGDKVDLWSLGNVVYIMLTGRPLYGGNERDILKKKKAGSIHFSKHFRWSLSEDAQDFVRKLLEMDPQNRLTAYEALCHPWIRKTIPQEAATARAEARQFLRPEDFAEGEVEEDVTVNKTFSLCARSTREFDPAAQRPASASNIFSSWWWLSGDFSSLFSVAGS